MNSCSPDSKNIVDDNVKNNKKKKIGYLSIICSIPNHFPHNKRRLNKLIKSKIKSFNIDETDFEDLDLRNFDNSNIQRIMELKNIECYNNILIHKHDFDVNNKNNQNQSHKEYTKDKILSIIKDLFNNKSSYKKNKTSNNDCLYDSIILLLIGHGDVNVNNQDNYNEKAYFLLPCKEKETNNYNNNKESHEFNDNLDLNLDSEYIKSIKTNTIYSKTRESNNSVSINEQFNNIALNAQHNKERHLIGYEDIKSLQDENKEYSSLYYKEILNLWENNRNSNNEDGGKDSKKIQNLLLLLDFSSAGGWIAEQIENKDIDKNNIYIVSSCAKADTAVDLPSIGSLFLQNLISENLSLEYFNEVQLEGDTNSTNNNNANELLSLNSKIRFDTKQFKLPYKTNETFFNSNVYKDSLIRNFNIKTYYNNYQDILDNALKKIFFKKYLFTYPHVKLINTTIYFDNFDYYEGEMRNSAKYGLGKYYHYDRKETYIGEYKDDIKSGKGNYYFRSGSVYKGEWKFDRINGNGKFYFLNGDVYEGKWVNNLREGKGKYTYSDGCYYFGEWFNDKKCGRGVYQYTNGDYYEGDWDNNMKSGIGCLYYNNGDRVVGEWKNDVLIDERSIYYYKNENKNKDHK